MNTQGANVTADLHLDGSASAAATVTINNTADGGVDTRSLAAIATSPFRTVQLRLTGSVAGLLFYGYGLSYRDLPLLQTFVDSKPLQASPNRRRFAGLHTLLDTLGASVTITPVLDATSQSATAVTSSHPQSKHVPITATVGRDLWATVVGASGFELYQIEPLIIETLPAMFRGQTPRALFGSPGIKVISGVQVRACTIGASVTVTLLVDGSSAGTFSIASGSDDPFDFTYDATAPIEGVEFALSFSGDVELYSWAPLITDRRPLGVTRYDSGPLDLGDRELVWLRKAFVKARVTSIISIAVYMDGQLVTTQASAAVPSGADTIVPIDFGRGVKGRQPRVVITSPGTFYPYWVRFTRRTSGLGSEKPTLQVALPLETGGMA
jgi:hypothetical protein